MAECIDCHMHLGMVPNRLGQPQAFQDWLEARFDTGGEKPLGDSWSNQPL